jgi:hypothetical protein
MFSHHQPDRRLSSVSTLKPVAISPQLAALIASKPLPAPPLLVLMHGYETGEILTIPARRRSASEQRYGGRFTRHKYQRSPHRQRSLLRRRDLAWRGTALPNWMAAQLTESERAYANLVREHHEKHGSFDLCHDKAAALMGVSSKTVQRSQHRLCKLEWISVEVRPRPGRKHDTNIVRITSPSWLMWIDRGPRGRSAPIGGQRCPATQSDKKTETSFANSVPVASKETMTTPPASAYCGVTKGATEEESAKRTPNVAHV